MKNKIGICMLVGIILVIKMNIRISAKEEIGLYALSACLMDGESGRVLYEKNGDEFRANASTTKILTCILALEYADLSDEVTVSKYAAGMPKVKLGVSEGEKYYLKDLLYSLMLESHNDVAVAIAEHIAGSTEEFKIMMNEKLKEIGCFDSYFITPNGLDATDMADGEEKKHGTTAKDLCRIMRYCKNNKKFMEITGTKSHSFTDVDKKRSHTVNNMNAFLDMMDGVTTGKTGFTSEAGYCYVCAFEKEGEEYIVSVLGSGWPNNKTYKWEDTKKLLEYGFLEYHKEDIFDEKIKLKKVRVINAKTKSQERDNIFEDTYFDVYMEKGTLPMLISEEDIIEIRYNVEEIVHAPVEKNQILGYIEYYVNGVIIRKYPVYVCESIDETNLKWVISSVTKKFFMAK